MDRAAIDSSPEAFTVTRAGSPTAAPLILIVGRGRDSGPAVVPEGPLADRVFAAGAVNGPGHFRRCPAAVIAVTTYGPFGEPERAAVRWLPWLRLGTALALTGIAFGVLAAGAAAGVMPGGTLALLRNLGGIAGVGLFCAVVFGGAFAWSGPMAYLLITEGALAHSSTTPWFWPTRLPHDRGGAICAIAVIAAGLVLITVRGPRDAGRESGPAS